PYTILDNDLVKRNAQKVQDLYVEKGYYLAEEDFRIDAVGEDGHEVDVVFVVIENAKLMVKRIDIVGNEYLSDEDIKNVLQTREGNELSWLTSTGTYKEEFFQTDMFRIQGIYLDHGFINIKVGDPLVTISSDRRYIYIRVPLTEGEQYSIGSI